MISLSVVFAALAAVLIDKLLGEPSDRFHPLVAFGKLANRVESRVRRPDILADITRKQGMLGWCVLVLIPTFTALVIVSLFSGNWYKIVFDVAVLYLCLGGHSLDQHARRVLSPLVRGELATARHAVAKIVRRDTQQLDQTEITQATLETVLKSGNSAFFAPLFWFLVLGAPGVIAYRAINTLDAMWGYRNRQYLEFGYLAARADDAANWIPARLTAVCYAIAGQFRPAIRCWRQQASQFASRNGGVLMTAGAGALDVQLGGPASYNGKMRQKPLFGTERLPVPGDISRALLLFWQSVVLWFGVLFLLLLVV